MLNMRERSKLCSTMFTADKLERLYSTTGYALHETMGQMKISAEKDCPLCIMLTDSDSIIQDGKD
jgi:hypothetical protein